MNRLAIPLYLLPATDRTEARLSLEAPEGGGAILLDRESFEANRGILLGLPLPGFHVFDSPAEARAAGRVLSEESGRGRGPSHEIGRMRDGEGVLVLFDDVRAIEDDCFAIRDHRSIPCRKYDIYGSWEIHSQETRDILTPEDPVSRPDLAQALAAHIAEVGNADLIQGVQIALERVPGAFVSFVSVEAAQLRGNFRLAEIDPARLPDELIQPHIQRAASKADLASVLDEAIEDAVARLIADSPDLADPGEEPQP